MNAFRAMGDKPSDPTKDPEFKRVLGNLLKTPPKTQEEMKAGKGKGKPRSIAGKRRHKQTSD